MSTNVAVALEALPGELGWVTLRPCRPLLQAELRTSRSAPRFDRRLEETE